MASQFLTLGRGELWFDRFAAGTLLTTGERYIGNSPSVSTTFDLESLDHYDSDHGVAEKDESIITQMNRTGAFTTDVISPENQALFFMGDANALTVTGGAVTGEAIGEVISGLTYQLGTTPNSPSGARNLSTIVPVVVKNGATTYVVDEDYTVDHDRARIKILPDGAIDSGTELTVDYSVLAHVRTQVVSGNKPIAGALRYLEFNPIGAKTDWYFPYVKLSPNGDFELKGDTWQEIPFSLEILKKTNLNALYCDDRPWAKNLI